MIKQISSINGELAIKIFPKDKLNYGDIIIMEKVESKKLKAERRNNDNRRRRI